MILSCERCNARYNLDVGQLGGSGRKVRCTSCGHSWFQAPETSVSPRESQVAPEFQTALAVAPAPAVESAKPAELSPEEQSRALRSFGARAQRKVEPAPSTPALRKRVLTLTALALPTAALIAAAVGLRGEIVEFWPPAARLYATIGLPAPEAAPGLTIRSVHMEEQVAEGHRTVIVQGELANTGPEAHKVPMLHASLGQGDETMARWEFAAGPAELAPGEVAQFRTQLANAPEGARTVSVGLWR